MSFSSDKQVNGIGRLCPGVLYRFVLLLLPAALLWAGGCDTSFEAYEETDRAFSVFGYLDANADTQYVRVEPLQDSSFVGTPSESIDAHVTTENLATGEEVVWEARPVHRRDSVILQNFQTTADFEPEDTYRFTVERERDGTTSTAEVTLPSAFPEPYVVNAPNLADPEGPTVLVISDLERLGGVRAEYDYESCVPIAGEESCQRVQAVSYHLADTTRQADGTLEIDIPWMEEIPTNPAASLGTFYSFRVTVAAASADWPEYAADNPPGGGPEGEPLPPPDQGTNVENGTGFLGGAFTRTVDIPIEQ